MTTILNPYARFDEGSTAYVTFTNGDQEEYLFKGQAILEEEALLLRNTGEVTLIPLRSVRVAHVVRDADA